MISYLNKGKGNVPMIFYTTFFTQDQISFLIAKYPKIRWLDFLIINQIPNMIKNLKPHHINMTLLKYFNDMKIYDKNIFTQTFYCKNNIYLDFLLNKGFCPSIEGIYIFKKLKFPFHINKYINYIISYPINEEFAIDTTLNIIIDCILDLDYSMLVEFIFSFLNIEGKMNFIESAIFKNSILCIESIFNFATFPNEIWTDIIKYMYMNGSNIITTGISNFYKVKWITKFIADDEMHIKRACLKDDISMLSTFLPKYLDYITELSVKNKSINIITFLSKNYDSFLFEYITDVQMYEFFLSLNMFTEFSYTYSKYSSHLYKDMPFELFEYCIYKFNVDITKIDFLNFKKVIFTDIKYNFDMNIYNKHGISAMLLTHHERSNKREEFRSLNYQNNEIDNLYNDMMLSLISKLVYDFKTFDHLFKNMIFKMIKEDEKAWYIFSRVSSLTYGHDGSLFI